MDGADAGFYEEGRVLILSPHKGDLSLKRREVAWCLHSIFTKTLAIIHSLPLAPPGRDGTAREGQNDLEVITT